MASAPRRPARRAVLVLALTLGLLTGSGAAWAFWSGAATFSASPLQSGTLDLVVTGASGALAGPGGSATFGLTLTAATPGRAASSTVTVGNAGTTPLVVTASAATTGTLGSSVVVTTSFGGAGATCAGGIGPTSSVLAAGASQPLCVSVALPASAPASDQGLSGTVVVTLLGRQP